MYYSFSVIFDIVAGITAHPLSQLFDEHMTKMLKEFEDAHRGTVTDEVLHDLAQNFSFPVPCLPGDMSLIEDFLADMDIQLRKEPRLALNIRLRLRLLHVGPVLFRLVIVRNYLDRPPENDGVIFQLVKQNRIFRLWTPHEQALAACNGEENTSPDSPLTQAPTPQLYNLAVIDDGDLPLSDDRPPRCYPRSSIRELEQRSGTFWRTAKATALYAPAPSCNSCWAPLPSRDLHTRRLSDFKTRLMKMVRKSHNYVEASEPKWQSKPDFRFSEPRTTFKYHRIQLYYCL